MGCINGHIPVLDDNGFIVWEAMAINLYLAEKYGHHPFWPSAVEGHAGAYQWSLWGETELERHVLTIQLNEMLFSAVNQGFPMIEPNLSRGKTLVFASSYNITYKFIVPPADVDVVLVAPRMIGHGVLELPARGEGFPVLVGVKQDASGRAQATTLAIAHGIGAFRTFPLKRRVR